MIQGWMQTKENSQLVLNTTTGLPPSSTFFIFLLLICRHYTSPCNFQMQNLGGQETRMWNIVSFSSISACSSHSLLWISVSDFLSAWTGGWMEGEGWVDIGLPHTRPIPVSWLRETGWRVVVWMVESGGSCRGLVPATAGSGRVGIWVLEVDSPMPRCMCRVLGVCFWHLFCYVKKTRWNILTLWVLDKFFFFVSE